MLAPDYAITRSYPWRRFGPIFFVASCIVLIVLTLLNAAVAGYETVTVARSDKNATQWMWWTPLIPRALRETTTCDSYLLNMGATFTTNNSMFQWSVISVFHSENSDGTNPVPDSGFQYFAAPLSCDSSGWDERLVIEVDISIATVTTWTVFSCNTMNGLGFEIMGEWQWHISQDVAEARIFGTPSAVSQPIYDVLSRLAQDLLEAFLTPPPPGIEGLVRLAVDGWPYCPSFQDPNRTVLFDPTREDELQCAREPLNVAFTGREVSWTNGSSSYKLNDVGLGNTEPAFRNFLKALIAAAEIDLGIYKENSLYFDMEIFNATIEPNPLLAPSHFIPSPDDADMRRLYFVMSSTATNLSNAQILRMYPTPPPIPQAIPLNRDVQLPAIINVSYLCHDLRMKSPLAFISSVFVGTISMFMAFRSFVLLIATILAKRHSDKANYCEAAVHLEEGLSRVHGDHIKAAGPLIEVGSGNAVLEMRPFHRRNGSEVTLSVQPATSLLLKDDGSAVYDTEDNSQSSSELSTLLGITPGEK
ncbi:hypothetical protein JAAARDRAFT_38414 [Jaapia argillacea MUCL 33604]|uniref:Uncharacterized protein n=1 Tax=Jaapia argillacea MUCL 33604 TaxID=933084 RepID=A0A067PK78_9AGAM|nr:hypothetical protein JAAARDRAFT_38414 [Jaapia argillacea MUCL 33604]